MGRSRFQNHWMNRPEFVDWLRRDSTDVFRAYCRVCQRSFDVKNMGEGAVKSHGLCFAFGLGFFFKMAWKSMEMAWNFILAQVYEPCCITAYAKI